jgi:hypothetical protein
MSPRETQDEMDIMSAKIKALNEARAAQSKIIAQLEARIAKLEARLEMPHE